MSVNNVVEVLTDGIKSVILKKHLRLNEHIMKSDCILACIKMIIK